jgi:hypothetical protein
MDEDLRELRERIARMSDAELWHVVGKDRQQYRAEAVQFAREELDARQAESAGDEADTDEADDNEVDAANGAAIGRQPCNVCGGQMRRGALFADREITVYFDDTEEERFLEAEVCSACGNVRLVVDLDTDVQE